MLILYNLKCFLFFFILLIGIITAISGAILNAIPVWAVMLLLFVIGGSAIAIYPLCLAHANDRYPGHFLQVGTVILMVNGSGSIAGPLLGANAMDQIGPAGFLAYLASGLILCFIWILIWLIKHPQAPENKNMFVGTAKSTQALIEMDPRTEAGEPPREREVD